MGLGPETKHPPSVTQLWGEKSGGNLRICAFYLEDIISYTMNVCRPGLDKTVWQSLHVPQLLPPTISVFIVVVSKHRGPGNLPLGNDFCEFGQDGFRVP